MSEVGMLEINDANRVWLVPGWVQSGVADDVDLARCTQPFAGFLLILVTAKITRARDHKNFIGVNRLAFTPARPAFVRATGIVLSINLVDHYLQLCAEKPLAKLLHSLLMIWMRCIIFMAITQKYLCHPTTVYSNLFMDARRNC